VSLSVGYISVAFEIKIHPEITYSNVSTNSLPMLSEQGILTEG